MKITMKAARVNRNMNQKSASAAIGVDVSTLSSWERGVTYPKMTFLPKICSVYGIDLDDLFLPKESI